MNQADDTDIFNQTTLLPLPALFLQTKECRHTQPTGCIIKNSFIVRPTCFSLWPSCYSLLHFRNCSTVTDLSLCELQNLKKTHANRQNKEIKKTSSSTWQHTTHDREALQIQKRTMETFPEELNKVWAHLGSFFFYPGWRSHDPPCSDWVVTFVG